MTFRRNMVYLKDSEEKDKINTLDDAARFFIENKTSRAARVLEDFQKGRLHAVPCICWLCLWRKFETMRPVGPPYEYLTFLAYDLLCEARGVFQNNSVKKISIQKLAKEIIRRLPIINSETKALLNEYSRDLFAQHFVDYAHRGRYRRQKFLDIVEDLVYQIDLDWKRGHPQPLAVVDPRILTPARLAGKIARFVYSRPGFTATQREIQRHTNKKKDEIEALHEWLEYRFGISVPPREKWESTVYIGNRHSNIIKA